MFEFLILTLVIGAVLGLIPANIAKNKGYSFGLWWFYGWMLFIVAIIHVQFIPDKNAPQYPVAQPNPAGYQPYPVAQPNPAGYQPATAAAQPGSVAKPSVVDELKQYKELLDKGILTEEEFNSKKEQLLKLM